MKKINNNKEEMNIIQKVMMQVTQIHQNNNQKIKVKRKKKKK